MSVAFPIIDSIDPVNRLIYLKSTANFPPSKIIDGKLVWNPIDDIYTEVRNLRRIDESLRPYDMFCTALPLIDKGGGKTTGRGLVLEGGTRIVPFDEDQTMIVNGELLSDEGISGSELIDTDSLSAGTKVKINYEPPPTKEVVEVDVTGGLTPSQESTLNLILNILEGDVIPTPTTFRILHKLTKAVLVEKDANEVDDLTQLTEPI